jgi:hypothetical protein
MTQTLITILLQILASLVTKKVVRKVLAATLKWAVGSSKTPVDDEIAKPIIDRLEEEEA